MCPGFLGTVGVLDVSPVWTSLYNYAWFISFGLSSAVVHLSDVGRWPKAGLLIRVIAFPAHPAFGRPLPKWGEVAKDEKPVHNKLYEAKE